MNLKFNGNLKIPRLTKLNIPELLKAASALENVGKIAISDTNLTYLDIHDDYIHRLYPLLADKAIQRPDYFDSGSAGAHISVIYPEENKIIKDEDLNQEHHFLVKDLVIADLGIKIYYVLLVESPALLKLRRKYDLPDLLSFKGYSIGFHVTIGVKV